MGVVEKKFSLDGFKKAIQSGLFYPDSLSYGYVDVAKFEQLQKQQKWNAHSITKTFDELQQRMSRRYFKNVMLAQACALDYAALQFPAYSVLLREDLSDDWLAIVDFHKKYCRDHSLHQPLTAYIAASLLGFGKAEDSLAIPVKTDDADNLLDYCINVIFKSKDAKYILECGRRYGLPETMLEDNLAAREFWKGLFYRTVILSALFHDMGYPWQYVNLIGKDLKANVSILHPIENTALNIVKQFKNRMVLLPLRHYQTNHENEPINEKDELQKLIVSSLETHGFPGAIAFLSLNDAIRKYPSNHPNALLQEFSVEWAAMGIFMHDMANKHKKSFPNLRVDVWQDPLSAIISLSDYLEEFNRPKVTFLPKAKITQMKYYYDCKQVAVSVSELGVLSVKMTYTNKSSKAIAASFKQIETEDYFASRFGYVDLESMGIKKVLYEQTLG